MTASTARPVIPPPPAGAIVSGASIAALSVSIDNVHVIYVCDEASTTLSIESDTTLCSIDLYQALKKNARIGSAVLTVELGEGGVLLDPIIEFQGTPKRLAAVIAAIPHLYAAISDACQRNALRMIYTRLVRGAGREDSDD